MIKINWRNAITDEQEKKIFEALENPKWDWRTARALSKATGLKPEKVLIIIAKYPHLIRRSAVPSEKGEDLFTLQSRFYQNKKGLDFLTTSST